MELIIFLSVVGGIALFVSRGGDSPMYWRMGCDTAS